MNPRGTPENLRPPWRKGESGNPGGRRRTPPFTRALEKVISMRVKDVDTDPKPGDPLPLAIVKRMFYEALHGDMRTAFDLAVRVDGPIKQAQGGAEAQSPYGSPERLRQDLAVRFANVWIERDLAYKLPLPKFAQEAVREMDPETVAEAERAGLLEPLKTPGTPREGEEPQRGPVGGADPKPEEEK